MKEITYANVETQTPENWPDLRVVDEATGKEIHGVIEVNTKEGWAVCFSRPIQVDPATGELARERITGRFRLEL